MATIWRRILSSQLHALTVSSTSSPASRSASRFASVTGNQSFIASSRAAPTYSLARPFSSDAENVVSKSNKRVEDVMPIATGHEREEIQAELEGRDILEINHPVGPFGTKEEPAVVKSVFDRRIVGCPGGEGEDEHDVVWFWLEKNKPHECPVCSQYFVLEVVGPGGDPYGHGSEGEDEDEHH